MGIPEILDFGCKWWTLDSLDAGHYTLEAGFWTLDTVVDWIRTESEPSF